MKKQYDDEFIKRKNLDSIKIKTKNFKFPKA